MTFLLPTLAIAFAALCVWLTVRILNRRGRWAKRTMWTIALAAILLVLYGLSSGPWTWYVIRTHPNDLTLLNAHGFYTPLNFIRDSASCPRWIKDTYLEYIKWWIVRGLKP